MSTLSGWCGQRGNPDCGGCHSDRCTHSCHGDTKAAESAQPRALQTVAAVDFWDNWGTTESSPRLQNPSALTPGGDRGPNRTAKEFG